VLDLDLRQASQLDISRLLHRLSLLGAPWGHHQAVPGGKKGTFHEIWQRWQPELAPAVIEAGVWGRTVVEAASVRTREGPALARWPPARAGEYVLPSHTGSANA